jgi:hypothetical protein
MRTTLDIEDLVLKDLRAIQKREGSTLGALVSRLLAQAIAQHPRRPPRIPLAWTARPMRALLDLGDKDAVYAALDDQSRVGDQSRVAEP